MSAVHVVTTEGAFPLTTEWRRDEYVRRVMLRKSNLVSYLDGAVPRNGLGVHGLESLVEHLPQELRRDKQMLQIMIPETAPDFEGTSWHGAAVGAALLTEVNIANRLPLVIVAAMGQDGGFTGRLLDPARKKSAQLGQMGAHWLIAPAEAHSHLSVPGNEGRRIPITTMKSLFRAIRLYLAATSDHVDMVRLILDGGASASLREEFGTDAIRIPGPTRDQWLAMVGPESTGASAQWHGDSLQRDPLMLAALRASIATAPPPPGRILGAGRQFRTDINPFSVVHPGCVVILIDQSGSMKDHVAVGGRTVRDVCTAAVNAALRNLANICTRQKVVQPRLVVGVIGYGTTAVSAWGPKLQSWAKTGATLVPLDVMDANKEEGGTWIAPRPSDESGEFPGTAMGAAIEEARKWCAPWAAEHRESLPPILINITDGNPDAGTEDLTRDAAEAFKAIETDFGNGIVLTYHVSKQAQAPAIEFPDATDLERMTPECRLMFDISSDLPDWMVSHARDLLKASAVAVKQGSRRGLVFGAPVTHLTEVLRFASRGPS